MGTSWTSFFTCTNIMQNVFLFILIVLVQVLMDPTYRACETQCGRMLLILHHMIAIGIWLGSVLFGHHRLHLLLTTLIGGLHIALNGCFLTPINNEMCNFEQKHRPFITFANHISSFTGSKLYRFTFFFVAFLVVMYDVFHIRKMTFCQ